MKVAGSASEKKVTMTKTAQVTARTAAKSGQHPSRRDHPSLPTKPLARKEAAPKRRTAIHNWVDLLGELGVMKEGIPGYPMVCMKSMRPMPRKATPRKSV